MLEDRSYMRGTGYGDERPATTVLMIVNTAIFVLQSIVGYYHERLFETYMHFCALSVGGLKSGFIWQLFTFQFMHAGPLHLIGNLLAIYFFGRAIEQTLGRSNFLKLYFGAGVIGGLAQILLAVAFPTTFGGPVVGASAGAFGLVAAFATMFPNQVLTLLVFFIIPVSMRARTLLWISIGLAVFGILVPVGNVADGAHLGGIAAGVAFVRWVVNGDINLSFPAIRWPWSRRASSKGSGSSAKPSVWPGSKTGTDVEFESDEFISREVDPILDKISAHGIHSLTERERRILEAARARMAKR